MGERNADIFYLRSGLLQGKRIRSSTRLLSSQDPARLAYRARIASLRTQYTSNQVSNLGVKRRQPLANRRCRIACLFTSLGKTVL